MRLSRATRAWLGIACAMASLGGTRVAAAAGNAQDKAAAEALFDEGLRLLKAGQYAEACSKLEASEKADPGIGTMLYLGECYEKQGRLASAWATFREAASMADTAGQTERAKKGEARADKLAPRLSRLTIVVAPENASLPGLEVRRGSVVVSSAVVGTAVPVDTGAYVVAVSAPGYETAERSIKVEGEGTSATLEFPPLVKLPEPAAVDAGSGTTPPPAATAQPSSEPEAPSPPGEGQRTLGLVLGGAGLVGLGVGGVFGILAISSNGSSDCDRTLCLSEAGAGAAADARSQAQIADIAFIAGGALLATGAVLYFTAPSPSESVSLEVRLRGPSLFLGGKF